MRREFSHSFLRWLLKGWFLLAAFVFTVLLVIDVFEHRWFIVVWIAFSLGLAWYVAPAIRVGPEGVAVKYLWRYHAIPWSRIVRVRRTFLGAQIMTAETHPAYRVVSYQFPMPGVDELVRVLGAESGGRRRSP
jgi:hypothetical protein